MHTIDLVERELVHLDIDHKQMGVGGENSWGAQPLKKYKIKPKKYTYHLFYHISYLHSDTILKQINL